MKTLTTHRSILVLSLLLCLLWLPGAQAQSNIDPEQRFAWTETSGWLNFSPTDGGVVVMPTHLIGFAWGENIGWIKLNVDNNGPFANTSADDWGVNRNPDSGQLSGFAWSETVGWLNFGANGGQASIDPGTGEFEGYVWSENIGWIHLSNADADADADYGIVTWFLGIPTLSFAALVLLAILLGVLAIRRHRVGLLT